jgi:hypothetical protein
MFSHRALASVNWFLVLFISMGLIPSLTPHAQASPIQYITTGIGSGSINNSPFTNANFTIICTADTSKRVATQSGGLPVFEIPNDIASININGVGTFQFVTQTITFVNPTNRIVGFERASPSRDDLYDGPTDTNFASWQLITAIGPISGTGDLIQWSNQSTKVQTSGGPLVFADGASPVTFTATIPEPASLSLLALGAMAVICSRPRSP